MLFFLTWENFSFSNSNNSITKMFLFFTRLIPWCSFTRIHDNIIKSTNNFNFLIKFFIWWPNILHMLNSEQSFTFTQCLTRWSIIVADLIKHGQFQSSNQPSLCNVAPLHLAGIKWLTLWLKSIEILVIIRKTKWIIVRCHLPDVFPHSLQNHFRIWWQIITICGDN
jgi:hypothetical protein